MKTVFDVSKEKINTNECVIEPVWNYIDEVNQIKSYIKNLEELIAGLRSQIDSQNDRLARSNITLNEQMHTKFLTYSNSQQASLDRVSEDLSALNCDITNRLSDINKEVQVNQESLTAGLSELNTSIQNLNVKCTEYRDQYVLTYKDLRGKVDEYKIKKIRPDQRTLIESDGLLKFRYQFNDRSFKIKNNDIRCVGLYTAGDAVITGQEISTSLNKINSSIADMSYQTSAILRKLNTVNGYITSNNFKKAIPTQEQLSAFAIECLPATVLDRCMSSVPTGTKIKNTFDNHIWILNRITFEGLTSAKWEDFGSDNICTASNDGVYGLVTGSLDRLKGHVDLKGNISINGLEEELNLISNSITTLSSSLSKMQAEYNKKFLELESRIRFLEDKK